MALSTWSRCFRSATISVAIAASLTGHGWRSQPMVPLFGFNRSTRATIPGT
jgi:hypothetical protein